MSTHTHRHDYLQQVDERVPQLVPRQQRTLLAFEPVRAQQQRVVIVLGVGLDVVPGRRRRRVLHEVLLELGHGERRRAVPRRVVALVRHLAAERSGDRRRGYRRWRRGNSRSVARRRQRRGGGRLELVSRRVPDRLGQLGAVRRHRVVDLRGGRILVHARRALEQLFDVDLAGPPLDVHVLVAVSGGLEHAQDFVLAVLGLVCGDAVREDALDVLHESRFIATEVERFV